METKRFIFALQKISMKVSLGFSTCPNDTFMFDALVNKRIDTQEYEFELVMADIKELNDLAFDTNLDITKLSYHAYTHLLDHYQLLDAGSALGHNCGPLLISKNLIDKDTLDPNLKIAIPGKFTTANLLFSLAYPNMKNKKIMLFHEIENAVLNGTVDLGLIIHENRFTYQDKGLYKVIDLGEYWESTFNYPIPLGGIVAKRSLGKDHIIKINNLISQSVQYALNHPNESQSFVLKHAQEMQPEVIQQHISLYVNSFSIALGAKGRAAVQKLFDVGIDKGLIASSQYSIFIS